MTWDTDLEALKTFRERLPVPWRGPDIVAARPTPGEVEASWRVLYAAFRESAPVDQGNWGLVELAAMVLGAVGGHGPRAIEELALGNPSADGDFQLVPLLLTITDFDHDLFFEKVRDALDSEDPRLVARGLRLLRAGYGARFRFRITPVQADALDAAVSVRKALGTDDPALAELLDRYVRPA